ncbi:MAG: hypothetical protein IJT58_06720 [Synergistaceae bacterium]|nr:hypothetical protein [Synergistaceae bacterium]
MTEINECSHEEHQKLIEILAKAWETLDASELVKYVHDDFEYNSQKVFASMYADEYPAYIVGKFQTIKRTGSKIDVSIVDDNYFGGKMIKLIQDETNVAYLRIKTKDGKISKMDMCMF